MQHSGWRFRKLNPISSQCVWFWIKSQRDITDVRTLSHEENKELSSQISADFFSVKNRVIKIRKLEETSVTDLKDSGSVASLVEILREDIFTLKKVSKTNLFTYSYLPAKTQSKNDAISQPKADSSSVREVAPIVVASKNQIPSRSKRMLEDDSDCLNSTRVSRTEFQIFSNRS